jgi:ADP-dependent phosphofructokinase/glucokinase
MIPAIAGLAGAAGLGGGAGIAGGFLSALNTQSLVEQVMAEVMPQVGMFIGNTILQPVMNEALASAQEEE